MGRRWGKTLMSGAIALAAASQGNKVAWVAPTYKQSRPLWRWAEATAGGIATAHKSERVLDFGIGFVGIYSADNADSMRGESFNLVIVDEAARVSEEAWTDVIQPTLADYDGDAMLISTPKGRNWFWREWMRGQTHADGYAAFTAPSSANPNPNIQRAARLAQGRVSERTYRQEWMAEFIEDGTYFQNVAACATAQKQSRAVEGHAYHIGVDWARAAGGDYTVFAVVDATAKQCVTIERMNGMDYERQLSRLRDVWTRFGQCSITAEWNSMGGPLVEQLRRDGLPVMEFTTTAATKHGLMTALEVAFDRREIGIIDDAALVGELQAFEKHEREGYPRYGAPEGMHDDTVMALALAWSGASAGIGVY